MSIAEMSSDDSSDKECPLCMEAFDLDDFNFFPCNCQYQICRFCWHRIRTNENGLCPACRQSYPEDPVNFQPLTSAELQKIKTDKKQKVLQQKNKIIESRKHLSEYRVLQKNLVYAVGISQRMASPELLKKPEFFGKFGKVLKIAVGTAQAINNSAPPTHTAYVTYARCEDALKAIEAINNIVVEGRLLKASLGTTKYCSSFLKGQTCYKPECMYLHEVADDKISFTKEDMHQGKHTEYERRLHEKRMSPSTFGQNVIGQSVQQNRHASTPSPVTFDDVVTKEELSQGKQRLEYDRRLSKSKMSATTFGSNVIKQNHHASNSSLFVEDDAKKEPEYERRLHKNKLSTSSTFGQNVTGPTVPQQNNNHPSNSSAVNFFVDDDDLGFDPFEESAKALKEIMQEEKKNFVPIVVPQQTPAQQPVYFNGDKYNINNNNHNNSTRDNNSFHNNNNHHHQPTSLYTTTTHRPPQQQQHHHHPQQQQHSIMPQVMNSLTTLQQRQQQQQNYHQQHHHHHQNMHQQHYFINNYGSSSSSNTLRGSGGGGRGGVESMKVQAMPGAMPSSIRYKINAKYKGIIGGFKTTLAEDGARGLAKGWAPTAIGYSLQGLGKFGLYELFKNVYSGILGEEIAFSYRTSLYLAASASAEFFADIMLAPMEAVKVRIQTSPTAPPNLRGCAPFIFKTEGLMGFYKGLPPLWMRQIPYTMMKFACFERTVELLYHHIVPKPRAECSKPEQLLVTFVAGYIAGVFCAIVSHPADTVVSKLNKDAGASAVGILKKLGPMGVWGGLVPRIIMIGTLTALQWFIYDFVKVALDIPRPPPPEMPASLKKKLEAQGKLA
ncbi:hypothetical protein Mgra_00000757 [Meloidogyne graminicola]|uniref:Phosphate carrier protein, mitochondrial n=1 Tax=Meloidogyne graminicola TaxID=189291 RepID=A0A8T0A202_9BILA|nr:hypothetical protein Mgra_00000757 [Meloidogyne graminicola]